MEFEAAAAAILAQDFDITQDEIDIDTVKQLYLMSNILSYDSA